MLTRIEIDGFKTFKNFAVDLFPFQVILGPNAVGKSNLFDALRLLSRLAEVDLYEAFQDMRGEPHEMFSKVSESRSAAEMTFSADVLIDPVVHDPWGVEVRAKHTRIRYSLTLARRQGTNGVERLYVTSESASPILERQDAWVKRFAHKALKDAYVKRGRRAPWLETETRGEIPSFKISQDGHAGRDRPADAAESTNLSAITSAEFPHLFALREEFRTWRSLQLNPEALRRPSSTLSANRLMHDGSNLAAVLARIRNDTRSKERLEGVIPDISSRLLQLVSGVRALKIVEDSKKSEYRVDIIMQDGTRFPSRVLSDGTLRILALVTLMCDPKERGLICFEEPENGVHPHRLGQMIETLRSLTTNLQDQDATADESLKQVLMNSHSPVVLKNLEGLEVLFADMVTDIQPCDEAPPLRCTRLRRVEHALLPSSHDTVTTDFVKRYLESAQPTEESIP